MTIRFLLRAVFAATITLAAGLLLIILFLQSGQDESMESAQQRYELSHLAKFSSSNSIHLTELARQHVVTLDPRYEVEYHQLVDQIQGKAAWLNGEKKSYEQRLRAFNVAADDLALLQKSNDLSLKLVETEEKAFSLVSDLLGRDTNNLTVSEHKRWVQAIELLTNDAYMAEVEKIQQPVKAFLSSIEEKSAAEVKSNHDRVVTLSLISTALVLTIIATLILCYWQLEKKVIKATHALIDEAKRISEGDLSCYIDHKADDEIGQLASSFNIMVDKLSQLLKEIHNQSEQAQVAAKSLDEISQQAKTLNDIQSQAIEVISSSVYENSTAVKEVSQNCAEAASSATAANQKTQEGLQVVQQGVSSVESVADTLTKSLTDLNQLEASVNEVTVILSVISNIAEQTNLLALNAAIEAARAGEQGRGFAVVADEVRTLASRTHTSTLEINRMLETLQSGVDNVADAMERTKSSCEETMDKTAIAENKVDLVVTSVARIRELVSEIAIASKEQSHVANEVDSNMNSIKELVDLLVVNRQETGDTRDSLNDSSKSLSDLVSRFTV